MAKAKVQTLATEQPRVNLAGMTQKALERCGLNRGLARCLRSCARDIEEKGARDPRRYRRSMDAFLRDYGAATAREKLVVQELLLRSDAVQDAGANGCGPDGFGGVVPDFCFRECCNRHDQCYATGGAEEDRLLCDLDFHDCCKATGPDWLAYVYFQAVRQFGAGRFNYHD